MKSIMQILRQARDACLISLMMFCVSVQAQAPADENKALTASTVAIVSAPTAQLSANIPVIRDNAKNKSDDMSPAWLGTVIALLAASAYILIKLKFGSFTLRGKFSGLQQKNENTELKIKKQLMLTTKTSLHLISWNGDELLIACSDNQVTVLDKKKSPARSQPEADSLLSPNERTLYE
ncbi:flagellar biosynthetic protein FliO [Undibacterium sp. Di27W]|uniref:flagellar biosynthetic protein FliO n=1 Tax=Undibacterium sp. Di27W TaxID=3413036 RepID=UPI003BF1149D